MGERESAMRCWKWTKVISDEIKIDVDGPDGFQYNWHDLKTLNKIFTSRYILNVQLLHVLFRTFCQDVVNTIYNITLVNTIYNIKIMNSFFHQFI